jgi:hypothetical protein
MSLSIVIPVYEDRETCVALVPTLLEYGEIVVVDASREDPVTREDLPPGVILLRSEQAQRAEQMNLGVEQATGSELLFLHADTHLSQESWASLGEVWGDPAVVGGGFSRRFDSSSLLLRVTCCLADWRGRWWGHFLGDQAIFVRRAVFEEIGGYRNFPVFEDYDLCRRLKTKGLMPCLNPPVLSSARRFRGGVVKQVVADFILTMRYFVRGERE